jgi:hypothetical protein
VTQKADQNFLTFKTASRPMHRFSGIDDLAKPVSSTLHPEVIIASHTQADQIGGVDEST